MSAVTEQQAAAPAGEGLSPLRHVYLLDDLTGLIPTLPRARELGEEAVAEAVGAVRRCVLNVAGLIDLDHIAVELISWDHTLAEFLARTPTLPAHDVAIVIGSGEGVSPTSSRNRAAGSPDASTYPRPRSSPTPGTRSSPSTAY